MSPEEFECALLEKLIEEDPSLDVAHLVSHLSEAKRKKIAAAFKKTSFLSPIKDALGPKFSYSDIRLVRLVLKKEGLI